MDNGLKMIFPRAQETTLLIAMVVMLGLLVLAVAIEFFRRRRDLNQRLAREWRTISEIFKEKELTPNEQALFKRLIQKHARLHPLQAVTLRQNFDTLIKAELAEILREQGREDYESIGVVLRDIRIRLGLDFSPIGHRILSTRELVPTQIISVAAGDANTVEWYRMQVVTVDEAYFYIGVKESELPIRMKPGDAIRCRMWREEDARYVFTSKIVRMEESPLIWVMEHTEDLKRMQTRAHFRVRYEEPVFMEVLHASLDEDYSDVMARPAVTRIRGAFISISAGGFSAVVHQAVPKQVVLRTTVCLEDTVAPQTIAAKLVDTQALSGGRYLVRATFVGISDEVRDEISKFAIHKQHQHLMHEHEAEPA